MAKISIEVDTKEKTMAVTINGAAVDRVRDLYVNRYMDYNGKETLEFRASTYEEDDNKDVKKVTHIMAKESEAGQKAIQAGAGTHQKFSEFCVTEEETKAVKDTVEFLQAYMKR